MVILVVSALVILLAYVLLNLYFKETGNEHMIVHTAEVFGALRAVGMSISAGLLTATIWKLKSAKVDKTDTGHLNNTDATVLLIM